MRFEWVREGPAEKCGSACQEWVSAKGTIMPDTAREFEAFARTRDVAGKVRGAGVRRRRRDRPAWRSAARFRRLNLTVAVGQTVMLPAASRPASSARPIRRAPFARRCVRSSCSVVRAGYVPPEARILVHQIWPGAARADSTAAIYSAQHVAAMLRATSEMARYTVDMGGEIELFDLSMRIPPWEDLRVLTQVGGSSARA